MYLLSDRIEFYQWCTSFTNLRKLNRETQRLLIAFEKAELKMRVKNGVRIYRGEDIRGADFTRVLADLAGRGIVPAVSRTKTRIR